MTFQDRYSLVSLSLSLYIYILYIYMYTYVIYLYVHRCLRISHAFLRVSIHFHRISPSSFDFFVFQSILLYCHRSGRTAQELWDIYIYIYKYTLLSLSLSLYIYIYTYKSTNIWGCPKVIVTFLHVPDSVSILSVQTFHK